MLTKQNALYVEGVSKWASFNIILNSNMILFTLKNPLEQTDTFISSCSLFEIHL